MSLHDRHLDLREIAEVADGGADPDFVEAATPTRILAVLNDLSRACYALTQLRAVADWHEVKAQKAERFPGDGQYQIMRKAAHVHRDAARRLRAALHPIDDPDCDDDLGE